MLPVNPTAARYAARVARNYNESSTSAAPAYEASTPAASSPEQQPEELQSQTQSQSLTDSMHNHAAQLVLYDQQAPSIPPPEWAEPSLAPPAAPSSVRSQARSVSHHGVTLQVQDFTEDPQSATGYATCNEGAPHSSVQGSIGGEAGNALARMDMERGAMWGEMG